MTEKDFAWVLNLIQKSNIDLNMVYNLNMKIPEVIIMIDGEFRYWYHTHKSKGHIYTRDENLLKARTIFDYFQNPATILEEDRATSRESQDQRMTAFKPLFSMAIAVHEDVTIYKQVYKKPGELLFKTSNEYAEFFKNVNKIVQYIPSKGCGLFVVTVTKDNIKAEPKIRVDKKDYSLPVLELADFNRERRPIDMITSNFHMTISKGILSKANRFNDIAEKTGRAIARFIEGRTRLVIGEIQIELLVDDYNTTWLMGCPRLKFYNAHGFIDEHLEKETIHLVHPTPLKYEIKCNGRYCDFVGETNFYEDGDDEAGLGYKADQANLEPHSMKEDHAHKKDEHTKKNEKAKGPLFYDIQLKSIILDIVECDRHKAKLKEALGGKFHDKQIADFINLFPFKFRKFYSISDLSQHHNLSNFKAPNLYKIVKICKTCHPIYQKIDNKRRKYLSSKKLQEFDPDVIYDEFDEHFNGNTPKPNYNYRTKEIREVLSSAFTDKIKDFDKPVTELIGLKKKTKIVDNFFTMRGPIKSVNSSQTVESEAAEINNKLPKVRVDIIHDEENMVSFMKLKAMNAEKNETMGYKHLFGSANKLPSSKAGFYLSRSSVKLSRLQDKLNNVSNLAERVQKKRQENSEYELDLVMCPYFGNGVKDDSRLQEFLTPRPYLDRVFSPKSSVPGLSGFVSPRGGMSKLQIAADKLEYLSPIEKEAFLKSQQRAIEEVQEKKAFLEEHKSLGLSIIQSGRRRFPDELFEIDHNGNGTPMSDFKIEEFFPMSRKKFSSQYEGY